MDEIVVLSHRGVGREEHIEFMKRLVLLYPHIKNHQQLHIYIANSCAESIKLGQFFQKSSPNVFLKIYEPSANGVKKAKQKNSPPVRTESMYDGHSQNKTSGKSDGRIGEYNEEQGHKTHRGDPQDGEVDVKQEGTMNGKGDHGAKVPVDRPVNGLIDGEEDPQARLSKDFTGDGKLDQVDPFESHMGDIHNKRLKIDSKHSMGALIQDKLRTDRSLDILGATENMLKTSGIENPFDSGVTFPKSVPIDLEFDLGLDASKMTELQKELYSFNFNAHNHSANELLGITFLIFKKLLSEPQLPEEVKISDQELLWFLVICRSLYNPHVPYHSYWHSVDVAQLTFTLIHAQPPAWSTDPATQLALVLAALGHDMKHPGLTVQIVNCIDPSFGEKWDSLEAYHLQIFETVLTQLWPAVKSQWSDVVQLAIEATEMAKHTSYITPTPVTDELSFVHALKISDFASAVRNGEQLSDITACLVFAEFYNQSQLVHNMSDQYVFPKQKVDIYRPVAESFLALQLGFLHHVVLPYFEWIAERIPWFDNHLKVAKNHYKRFQHLNETGELEDILHRFLLTRS